jgi:cyclohexa-1,5-dienecarbonyl-CoA hydratase
VIKREKREDGAMVRIVFDAPKGNILDGKMIRAISEALDADVETGTKLVVFEGAGKHFSFGASVEEHRREEAPAMLDAFHGLFRQLARLAVPTCAIVRGQCLGGGLELASYCTFLVATPDARLGQPEIRLAVFPPMASLLLPWRIGGGAALDLCVSGRAVDAAEAHRIGLVNAVAEDPEAWVNALFAESLRPTSASSLRFAERAARADLARRMEQDLPALERLYLDELMTTHDANEGIAAFIERRPPQLRNA